MGIFVVGFLGFLSWYGALAASHLCTLPGAPQALPTLLTQLAEKLSQLQSPLLCRTHKLFLRKMCLSPDSVTAWNSRFLGATWVSRMAAPAGRGCRNQPWWGWNAGSLSMSLIQTERRRAGFMCFQKLYIDFLQFCVYKMSASKKSGAWQDEASHVYCSCNYGNLQMPPVFPFHTQMRGQLWGPHVCQWNNICELGWLGQKITTHLY